MKEYHKIQTVFLRNPENRHKYLMENVWSLPEFKVLKNIEWIWTEKIDGTNIRIMYDGTSVRFSGKTDFSQIPVYLLSVIQDIFPIEKMKSIFGDGSACLYGEGFGNKIQSAGKDYLPDTNDFILFDVKIGDYWLDRNNIEDIANKLKIKVVPIIGKGTLLEAVEFAKKGFKSTVAFNKDLTAEGLVMKPSVELFTREGKRIITKIKYKDFPHLCSIKVIM